MKSLGFRVPLAIVNKAHQANQIYPFAISLIESVRTYERTLDKVSLISCLLKIFCGRFSYFVAQLNFLTHFVVISIDDFKNL